MAQSDKTRFSVGDRVKDRQTNEEGRIVDIRVIRDGALLLTVAFFVGSVIRKKSEYIILPGQIAHSAIEKIVSKTSSAAASILVTTPQQGATPSAKAIERSLRDQPPDPNQARQKLEGLTRSLKSRGDLFHQISQTRKHVGDTLYSLQKSSTHFLKDHPFTAGKSVPVGHSAIDKLFLLNVFTTHISDVFEETVESELRGVRTQILKDLRQVPRHVRRRARDPKTKKILLGRLAINEGLISSGLDEILKRHPSLESALERAGDSIVSQYEVLESIRDNLSTLKDDKSKILLRSKSVDSLLDYLMERGVKDPGGQWRGGFLTDVMLPGRQRPTERVLRNITGIEDVLRQTTISPEFASRFGLPAGIETGQQLLSHIRGNIRGLGIRGTVDRWYGRGGFADVLTQAIKQGYSPYASDVALLESINQQIEQHTDTAAELLSDPLLQEYVSVVRQNSDFSRGVKNILDEELDIFDNFVRTLEEQGVPVGGIDAHALRSEMSRRSQFAFAGRAGLPHGAVNVRKIPIGLDPFSIFDHPIKSLHRVVNFRGESFTISEIVTDPRTQGIWLTPVNTANRLFTRFSFEESDVAQQILGVTEGFPSRVAGGPVATAALDANRTIGVRGGLLNTSNRVVGVPASILTSFIIGEVPAEAVSEEILQSLGFSTRSAFEEAFQKFSPRALSRLQESIYATLDPDRQDVEDIFGTARQFLLENIHGIEEGRRVEEIAVLARQRAESGLRDFMRQEARAVKGFGEMVSLQDAAIITEEGDEIPLEDIVARERDFGAVPMSHQEFQQRAKHWRSLFTRGMDPLEEIPFKRQYRSAVRNLAMETLGQAFDVSDLPLERQFRASFSARRLLEAMRGGDETDIALAEGRLSSALGLDIFDASLELQSAFSRYRELRKVLGDSDPTVKELAKEVGRLQTEEINAQRLRNVQRRSLASPQVTPAILRNRLDLLEGFLEGNLSEEDAFVKAFGFEHLDFMTRKRLTRQAVAIRRMMADPTLGGRGYDALYQFASSLGINVGPMGMPDLTELSVRNWSRFMEIHDPLISIAEAEGVGGRLSRLPIEWGVTGEGLPGVILRTAPEAGGHPFLYRAGRAVSMVDPSQVVNFADQGRMFLHAGEYRDALEQGQWRLLGKGTAGRIAEQEAIVGATAPMSDIPLFRSETGRILGYNTRAGLSPESILENTRRIFTGPEGTRFVGLDIETDIKTGEVWNIALKEYERTGAEFTTTGRRTNIVRGDMLEAAKAKSRRVGHTFSPTDVRMTEREVLQKGIGRLLHDFSGSTIAGYNIGFDIGGLIERAEAVGLTDQAAALRKLSQTNLADIIFAAQAGLPNAKSLALEDVVRSIVPGHTLDRTGNLRVQAHVGEPDIEDMVKSMNILASQGEQLTRQLNVNRLNVENQFLWDRERRRAYQIAGGLDPEAATAYLRSQGSDMTVGAGIVLQPVDFNTGRPGDTFEMRYAKTPHGFAGMFGSTFEMLGEAEATSRMEQTVADLARRRVRRVTSGRGSFSNLLAEMERLPLAMAAAEGQEALAVARNDIVNRILGSESEAEQKLLRRTLRWGEKYLEDTRISSQLVAEARVFQEEFSQQHAPIIDWLKQSIELADDRTSAVERANTVWNEYIRRTEELTGWNRLPASVIPAEERQLSFNIDALGRNRRAIRIGSEELVRRDLNRLTESIAKRWAAEDPERLRSMLAGTTNETLRQFEAMMASKEKKLLDYQVGEELTKRIWEREIKPALQRGSIQIGGEQGGPFSLASKTMEDAISELRTAGEQFAQTAAVDVPDQLTPRVFDTASLTSLQREFTGRAVADITDTLASSPENLRFSRRHGVPTMLEGKSVADILRPGLAQAGAARDEFVDTLRRAAFRMSGFERGQLRKLLADQEDSADLFQKIFASARRDVVPTRGLPTATDVIAPKFHPGKLHAAAQDLSEKVARTNITGTQAAGLGAALITGLGILAAVMSRPKPGATQGELQEQGISSTDQEYERRRNRVLQENPQASKVSITISGEDPTGADHEELVQSIHSTLGNFFGREVAHKSTVSDQRTKIDRTYLDKIATRLMNQ